MKRKIKNALISVSDKTDLEKILLILKKNKVNICLLYTSDAADDP